MDQRSPHAHYRGRRRAPTPPRGRYVAVATTAFVGAGVVALGTGTAMPDMKAADPTLLTGAATGITDDSSPDAASRQAASQRADRATDRNGPLSTVGQPAPDVWLLPMRHYSVSSEFGPRWGVQHPGTDFAAPEGTPYYAAHAGTVKLARWHGGYGYAVILDVGNGVEIVHGHSSKLLVKEGQKVNAGDVLGLVGDTGYSYGPHLHFEVRLNEKPIDAVPFLKRHGVDIHRHVEAIYGGTVQP